MSTISITDWTREYFLANKTHCNAILETNGVLQEIPSLNNASLNNFKDRQLVRFRGMIQDMHNPEYYFEEYEVKNTQTGECDVRSGLYADSGYCLPFEEIVIDSAKNKNSERQTFVVISTPGLNNWAKTVENNVKNSDTLGMNSGPNKRSFYQGNVQDMDCDEPHKKKEKIANNSDDTEMEVSIASSSREQSVVSKEHMLNFPIPNADGKACIIKMYEDATLKLNQIIEIIGFISLDPALGTMHSVDDTMTEAEINTHHPPPLLVPRIHAIKILYLNSHNVPNAPEIISKAQIIRSELHLILSQLLFGDKLAADFLLAHLLSSIYMRKDHLCLGTYPLNVTHFPVGKYKLFATDFYRFLTILLEKSHFMEITLENLNAFALSPKKDYECNRLTSGILQMSDHTHLVIDETGLTAGQLSEMGRENYNALCNLINFQRVTYDFKFYKIEYEADIPILIFSEVKSFIPCPNQVRLKIDSDADNLYPQVLEHAHQYLRDENRLANIRQYLQVLRHTEFKLNEDIVQTIQDDFIELRQTNKKFSVDQLHSLMILSRFISLSYGENVLSTEYWKTAVQMEVQRMERLP